MGASRSGPDIPQLTTRVSQLFASMTTAATAIGHRQGRTQQYLARLADVCARLDHQIEADVAQAEIALAALLARPPRMEIAGRLLDHLERRRDPWWARVLAGRTVRGSIVRGMTAFLVLLVAALALFYGWVVDTQTYARVAQLDILPDRALVVGLAGAMGAVVSLLSRCVPPIGDRSRDTRLHAVMNGFIRPGVGWLSGIFAYLVAGSGLVSTSLLPPPVVDGAHLTPAEWAAFVVLAFVAGFSERWVSDIAAWIAPDGEEAEPEPAEEAVRAPADRREAG